MAATGSSSDIVSLNSIEFGTAWHFLPVLIRQGSSARLVELAFRSALAPDLVEILCRILGSPLKFISGGFISSSDAVVEAFVEFMTRTVSWYVPRDAFRVVGLRRGTWNVSLTYARKRKAPSLDNAAVSLSSSKRRRLLTHERGEGEPMKVEGLPKLLYHLNEIPEKENFDVSSGIDQHSVGMNAFDCSAVELDQSNNLHVSLHDLSCFASRNISYAKEEDTRESNYYITNSAFPYKKVVDFSYEQISLDVGLDANIINDEALQMVTMVEPDFRPILDQSSQANLTLREDCNTLSIELGFNVDIPELHVFERLNAIELDFETSLMDRVQNHTAVQQLDHNAQSASSPLACSNQPVLEAIDQRSLHSTDDKLITGQLETKETPVDSGSAYFHRKETAILTYEFGDVHKNSAEIEVKQKTFSEPSIKDHISSVGLQNLVGPNIAKNNISSTKKQDINFDDGLIAKQRVKNVCDVNTSSKERVDVFTKATKNSSDQKSMPNFKQIDHNAQSASSPLPCSNQLVLEAINERNLHSMDDKLITGQLETKEKPVDSGSAYFYRKETAILTYEFGDLHKNSAEIEDKQKTFSEPSIKDHIASAGLQNLVGPNIANNNISYTKKQDINFDDGLIAKQRVKNVCDVNTPSKERVDVFTKATKNSSDQKLMPNFKQIDHNAQSASSPLACSNQLVLEAINERNLHSTDDKLITGQLETKEKPVDSGSTYFHRKETAILSYEFGDLHKNSAAIEEKQKTFSEPSITDHIASVGLQNLVGPNIANNNISSTKKQDRNFDDGLIAKKRVKNVCNVNTPSKERVDAFSKATKNSSDQKLMPNFESFIIEEEEGSGGYGTVYKAHRKEDGKVFAVKCPHANANSHHVYNELKMLERFGGRNFVIKYECSFKNGDSECFVLEHVEHDRPEILKKEISLFELQWYGFCMFRALASLHKQGVVHRDVKPGNFLFSRKVNKGYLIDFNLASDLQQKFCRSSKRKTPSATVNPNSVPETKSTSIIHSRKFFDRDLLENAKKETADESKKIVTSKSSKKKAYKGDMGGFPIVERSKHGSQTADGSGVTSTKDQTSTKTPLDWLKQPIPYKGRKELINFVHKAMHNPQNLKTVSNGPSSQRKRIAAPMTKTDTRLLILTPMPLHSGGNAVAGAGMLKNKASGKVKREGPCVGTKGFRAPEVLFKSFHQGCKIDIWSAGVTMLYLMIGRAPFGGDPEQNIKEIAKLRGSEDLWEVAKLHNCESSFPVDLLEVGSLKSMELSDWCGKNSRRAEFHELIPESLFDLVDKCLAVNPRRRFSAEEALMHRFFSPCHESIRKQRLLRKVATEKP